MTTEPARFQIQDSQYSFPYHYLPALDPFALHRRLRSGMEYMTYLSFVTDQIARRKPESILDVGCGDGRLLHEAARYAARASGVDLSERAVGFAKLFNPDADIRCEDVANLTDSYEVVTLIEVLEHIPDEETPGFLAAVSARLAPNGLLIVSVPTINRAVNPKHYRHYSLESLSAALEPFVHIEEHRWLYRYNLLEKILRNLLCNDLLILNSPRLRQCIWHIHKRFNYFASEQTGTHLVLTATRRQ
jgi:2-polyprenyl-3-methyl-5-hydroxy-6-metoxy-1,4-benzoquinol methylase